MRLPYSVAYRDNYHTLSEELERCIFPLVKSLIHKRNTPTHSPQTPLAPRKQMATSLPNELIDEILTYLPVSISISLAREHPKRYHLKGRKLRSDLIHTVEALQWAYRYNMKVDIHAIFRAYDIYTSAYTRYPPNIGGIISMERNFDHAMYTSVPHIGTFDETMKKATRNLEPHGWAMYWALDWAVKNNHLDDVQSFLWKFGPLYRGVWRRILENAVLYDNSDDVIIEILTQFGRDNPVSKLVRRAVLQAARNNLSDKLSIIYTNYRPRQPWSTSWRKLHLEAINEAAAAEVVHTLCLLYLPSLSDLAEAQTNYPENKVFSILIQNYYLFSADRHSLLLRTNM